METKNNKPRIIISGGGTGGHIFPAVSIANAIKELCPDAEILFVGAEGRMEMQRVPDAGYKIIGLPVAGFDRKHLWKNFAVLVKLARSQWKARSIIKQFRPQVAVGVGGYASGPTLKTAGMMGVPTLIQEQNSYAASPTSCLPRKPARYASPTKHGEVLPRRENHYDRQSCPPEPARPFHFPRRSRTLFRLRPRQKNNPHTGRSLGARTINKL